MLPEIAQHQSNGATQCLAAYWINNCHSYVAVTELPSTSHAPDLHHTVRPLRIHKVVHTF